MPPLPIASSRSGTPSSGLDIAAATDRSWELLESVGSTKIHTVSVTAGSGDPLFRRIACALTPFAGKPVLIRLHQKTYNIGERRADNAFWRNIGIV